MAKRTNNKEAKPIVVEKPKTIDWDSLGKAVKVVALDDKHLISGDTYTVTPEIAKILIENKRAKLK